LAVALLGDGVEVIESLDHERHAAFFLPYPVDIGDGSLTTVERTPTEPG
jgi:hypothetical protein